MFLSRASTQRSPKMPSRRIPIAWIYTPAMSGDASILNQTITFSFLNCHKILLYTSRRAQRTNSRPRVHHAPSQKTHTNHLTEDPKIQQPCRNLKPDKDSWRSDLGYSESRMSLIIKNGDSASGQRRTMGIDNQSLATSSFSQRFFRFRQRNHLLLIFDR